MVVDVLEIATVLENLVLILRLLVLVLHHVCEAPALGYDNLLTTCELVTRAAKGFHNNRAVVLPGTDGEENLSDIDAGHGVIRLAVRTTHARLKPVGSRAGKHLVDTDDVEGMNTNTEVERVLARGFRDVLVGANSGSFESFRRNLLVLVANKVAAEREIINTSLLAAEVENADLKDNHKH